MAVVAVGAVLLALLHVLWLARFRWGYLTDWDEAGYISIALNDLTALGEGPRAFAEAVVHSLGTQPPVVPLSAIPLLAVFGRSVDVAQVMMPIWSVALVLATYGLARHLMAPRWAGLAALCVGTAPVVADYSRLFHFSVPAAALLTGALWGLLQSIGLRRTRWVIVAGILLALMITSRTMTVSYLPGVAVGAGLPLVVGGSDLRLRARNFVLMWLVALGIAALWWAPVWDTVTNYLSTAGYGAEATGYGPEESLLSLRYWTTELQVVANYLYLPLSLALLACFLLGALFAVVARGERRPGSAALKALLASPAVLPAAVVIEGYLALSSTVNQGTAFALPWLPALVVLALAAAASVSVRPVRLVLAALLVAVCVLNLAVKNGVSTELSKPRVVDVPAVGDVTVADGRDFIYASLEPRGYAVDPPPARLPALHKRWSTLNERLLRSIESRPTEDGGAPLTVIATGDWLINDTRLELASQLERRQRLRLGLLRPPDTLESYRDQLAANGGDLLIGSDPPRRTPWPLNPLLVAGAAQTSGFRQVETLRAPDGRRVYVWAR